MNSSVRATRWGGKVALPAGAAKRSPHDSPFADREPARRGAFLVEFLRDDVGCQVGPDGQREDEWCVQTTGASPLSKSSLGVLLSALTSVYDTLIGAGYYAYRNQLVD
jgi:hypothetical protein